MVSGKWDTNLSKKQADEEEKHDLNALASMNS